jgi:hypothetical protein
MNTGNIAKERPDMQINYEGNVWFGDSSIELMMAYSMSIMLNI